MLAEHGDDGRVLAGGHSLIPMMKLRLAEPAHLIDLNRVENLSGPEASMFDRFLRSIQMMRQDFNGKVLTIRRDDLRLLALLLEQTEEAFTELLSQLGLTDGA